MQSRFVLLALASAALFILPQSAYAQETQPGDACTTNGAVRSTGGPEQMPRRMLMCNGTTWQSALEQTTAGASLLQIGNDAGSCTTAKLGRIRYNGTSTWEYCNGTSWAALGGGGSAAGADREIQFNNSGAFGASSTFKLMADGDLLLTGTHTGTASVPVSGAGTRLFFDTQKAAFRVGTAQNNWDDANIGDHSIAMGWDTRASGPQSTAFGESSIASGGISTAMGQGTSATGIRSTAMGYNTTASGSSSTAMGFASTASSDQSFAVGNSTTASGSVSTALGNGTVASGPYTVAMGDITRASGWGATAIGRYVTAGNGTAGSGQGDGSIAFGLIDNAVTITTPSQVTGIQSMGIFMGDQDGLVLSTANQMSLLGGKMVIDSTIPATNLVADTELEIDGTLKIGSGGESCDAAREGSIRYLAASDTFETCATAGSWAALGGGSTSAAGSNRDIQFNSSGTLGASSTFKLMADGDLLLTGTYTGTASVPVTGAGTRLFFDTQTAAFRAGEVSGNKWDSANIGSYSTAMGYDALANGIASTAIGFTPTASGIGSVSIGNNPTASGTNAIGMGTTSIASGAYSLALGTYATASGSRSVSIGSLATAGNGTAGSGQGDGALAIGLVDDAVTITTAPQVTGIQSMGIFMGDQDGLVLSTANQMSLLGGKMVIDSTIPATNLVADTELEIDGTLKIGSGGEACDAAREGSIRYLAASDTFQVCATAGSWSAMGGGASLSALTAATAANTINNANFAQTWQWNSLTTGTGLALSSSSVTSGRILSVVSSGTSASGPAIYAESNANSSSGHGIRSSVNSSTGGSYAMYGSTFGPGAGVFGEATNTAVTGSRGVYGLSTGISGIGILGQGTSTTGTGVYGHAMAGSGTTYGVYGTSASSAGYGGYFTNTSTGVALRAQGDLEYTGSLRDMSDIRLKDNVKPLDSALDKIIQLQGISFTMKDSKVGDTEYGFSAQEVRKVFPDLVHQAPDADGTLSMNYTGLIAPLVEAMKEQQKEIEALKAEIEALKAQE